MPPRPSSSSDATSSGRGEQRPTLPPIRQIFGRTCTVALRTATLLTCPPCSFQRSCRGLSHHTRPDNHLPPISADSNSRTRIPDGCPAEGPLPLTGTDRAPHTRTLRTRTSHASPHPPTIPGTLPTLRAIPHMLKASRRILPCMATLTATLLNTRRRTTPANRSRQAAIRTPAPQRWDSRAWAWVWSALRAPSTSPIPVRSQLRLIGARRLATSAAIVAKGSPGRVA